jgi:hypothetical protein
MRRAQRGVVFVDERLKDAFDVCAYCGRVSRSIIWSRSFSSHKKAQEAQHETAFEEWFHRHFSNFSLHQFCAFMCLFVATFNNKYASGVSADVNGIAARSGPGIL